MSSSRGRFRSKPHCLSRCHDFLSCMSNATLDCVSVLALERQSLLSLGDFVLFQIQFHLGFNYFQNQHDHKCSNIGWWIWVTLERRGPGVGTRSTVKDLRRGVGTLAAWRQKAFMSGLMWYRSSLRVRCADLTARKLFSNTYDIQWPDVSGENWRRVEKAQTIKPHFLLFFRYTGFLGQTSFAIVGIRCRCRNLLEIYCEFACPATAWATAHTVTHT